MFYELLLAIVVEMKTLGYSLKNFIGPVIQKTDTNEAEFST